MPVWYHIVVSQDKGTPIQTPIYYSPYYGDPKKVPLIVTAELRLPKVGRCALSYFLTPQVPCSLILVRHWGGFPRLRGTVPFWGAHNKDCSILGSIVGSP